MASLCVEFKLSDPWASSGARPRPPFGFEMQIPRAHVAATIPWSCSDSQRETSCERRPDVRMPTWQRAPGAPPPPFHNSSPRRSKTEGKAGRSRSLPPPGAGCVRAGGGRYSSLSNDPGTLAWLRACQDDTGAGYALAQREFAIGPWRLGYQAAMGTGLGAPRRGNLVEERRGLAA